MNSTSCEWVEAKLMDGTTMVMTSDHPIRCSDAEDELLGCRTVLAGKLTPGQDKLRIVKFEQVPVGEVTKYKDTAKKVSIGLAHSSRYSMFVKFGSNQPLVAVESADYQPAILERSRTFVHFDDRTPCGQSIMSDPAEYHRAPGFDVWSEASICLGRLLLFCRIPTKVDLVQ